MLSEILTLGCSLLISNVQDVQKLKNFDGNVNVGLEM